MPTPVNEAEGEMVATVHGREVKEKVNLIFRLKIKRRMKMGVGGVDLKENTEILHEKGCQCTARYSPKWLTLFWKGWNNILHPKLLSYFLQCFLISDIVLTNALICMIAIIINKPDSTKPFLSLIRERFSERKLARIKRICGREVSFRSQKCRPSEIG